MSEKARFFSPTELARDPMSVWLFVRPSLFKFASMAILLALSLLVVTQYAATSKVTWEETRGVPLEFITLARYRGPCGPEGAFCHRYDVLALHPFPLALDVLSLYLVSCLVHVLLHRIVPPSRGSHQQAR
jgi:hypothetical protein